MTVDDLGVPENLVGHVLEDEYRLVARLVTVAALVQVNLYDLVTELERVPQTRYAGEQAATMLKHIATVVGSGTFREDYFYRVQPVLARARAAFELRNDTSFTAFDRSRTLHPGLAWRPVRMKQRVPGAPIVAVTVTLADLSSLGVEPVDLQAALVDLRVRSYEARLPVT